MQSYNNNDTYDLIKRVADPSETQIINQYNDLLDLFSIIINVISLMIILLVNVWWGDCNIIHFYPLVFPWN